MPLKILIVPDKFKGTLTANDAAAAIARGWRKARPHDALEIMPMSDGGDGFGEVMSRHLDAKIQSVKTLDAARRGTQARWWWASKTETAIIESANVIGLAMLPPGKFHPFHLDTFGLGAVVQAAAARGARRCLMGLGGSATNDGGFGLARSLGWEFLDAKGALLKAWTDLDRLVKIRAPERKRWFAELIVAVDVQNPLLGLRGATRVYGPQKGLRAGELKAAEHRLKILANVFQSDFGKNFIQTTGAGAAGGLGFGLRAFLGATLESGFDVFSRHAQLEKHLRRAALVLTGEGKLDSSTLMGKGVGEIARSCRRKKIPCVTLTGMIAERDAISRTFTLARALTEIATLRNAKRKPAFWLERLVEKIARECAAKMAASL